MNRNMGLQIRFLEKSGNLIIKNWLTNQSMCCRYSKGIVVKTHEPFNLITNHNYTLKMLILLHVLL